MSNSTNNDTLSDDLFTMKFEASNACSINDGAAGNSHQGIHGPQVKVLLANRQWQASLDIEAKRQGPRTIIARARHEGPLRIQRPFFPEAQDLPHLYLLHPPGGLVCGDKLKVNISSLDGAKLLITTPSAGKIYRTDQHGHTQEQVIHLDCTNNGHLEWLPQENIIYDGANGEQILELQTTPDSRFAIWDITVMGRPASAIPFIRGRFEQYLKVLCDALPYFQERVELSDAGPCFTSAWGLNGYSVYGSMLIGYTDQAQSLLEGLREHLQQIPAPSSSWARDLDWSVTRRDRMIILRALAAQSEPMKVLFCNAWKFLRPRILHVDACPPRIWST